MKVSLKRWGAMKSDKRPPETKVRLMVLGFEESFDEISRILALQPDETWKEGQTVTAQATNVHHENGWMIRSPVDPTQSSADEAVQALIDRLPDRGAFSRLPATSEVQLTITLFSYEDRPFLWLSKTTLSRVAEIGASLDVDVYDLTTRVEE